MGHIVTNTFQVLNIKKNYSRDNADMSNEKETKVSRLKLMVLFNVTASKLID